MKIGRRHLIGVSLLMAGASTAFAGPFLGMREAGTDVTTLAKVGGAIIGGLVTLVAGGRAAWKGYKDEDWVGAAIVAIIAAALAFIAGAAI